MSAIKGSFYEVWEFPHGVGPKKKYFVAEDPEGPPEDYAPSFKTKKQAGEFLKRLEEEYPGPVRRVVKITHEIF